MPDDAEEVTKTPEQTEQETKKNAVNNFIKEYGELVKKYEIDFGQYLVAVPIPNAPGVFGLQIQSSPVDVSNQPVKSNFIPD